MQRQHAAPSPDALPLASHPQGRPPSWPRSRTHKHTYPMWRATNCTRQLQTLAHSTRFILCCSLHAVACLFATGWQEALHSTGRLAKKEGGRHRGLERRTPKAERERAPRDTHAACRKGASTSVSITGSDAVSAFRDDKSESCAAPFAPQPPFAPGVDHEPCAHPLSPFRPTRCEHGGQAEGWECWTAERYAQSRPRHTRQLSPSPPCLWRHGPSGTRWVLRRRGALASHGWARCRLRPCGLAAGRALAAELPSVCRARQVIWLIWLIWPSSNTWYPFVGPTICFGRYDVALCPGG